MTAKYLSPISIKLLLIMLLICYTKCTWLCTCAGGANGGNSGMYLNIARFVLRATEYIEISPSIEFLCGRCTLLGIALEFYI